MLVISCLGRGLRSLTAFSSYCFVFLLVCYTKIDGAVYSFVFNCVNCFFTQFYFYKVFV